MRHKLDPLRQPRPITKVGADIPASRMGGTPAGFTHFIRRDVDPWTRAIRSVKIQAHCVVER